MAYLTSPIMFLLIVLAKPFFILLYSEKWLPSVPYFQVLCLAGVAGCLQFANNQAIAAIGKSKEMFHWTLVKRTVGIAMIVGGLALFEMPGLLVGTVLQVWFMYLFNIHLVSKHIGYKWSKQLLDLLPIFLLTLASFTLSFLVNRFLPFNIYVNAVFALLVFIIVYYIGSKLFRFEELETIKQLATRLVAKLKRKYNY